MTLKEQIALIGAWLYKNQDDEAYELMGFIRKSLHQLEKLLEQANPKDKLNHRPYLAEYASFYERFVGVKPKVMSGDAAAMIRIAKYLIEVSNTSDEDGGLTAWIYILKNWTKLTPYLQKQTRITQIEKNINEIITQLRNGKSTSNNDREKLKRDIIG